MEPENELIPMSKEEQAQSQLNSTQPPKTVNQQPTKPPDKGSDQYAVYQEEHKRWWNMPNKDPSRAALKDLWYKKWYGKSEEEIRSNNNGGFYPGSNSALSLQDTLSGLSVLGLSAMDFPMDVVGWLPGAAPIDNAWDRMTKLKNGFHQKAREFSSIVIPSVFGGAKVAKGISKLPAEMPRLQKALVAAGLFSATDAAIIGLHDQGEDHNMLRALADWMPGVFGEKGAVPIPDAIKTLDSDSASIRRRKNMWDTAGLSILGTITGAAIQSLKGGKRMDWFKPLDEAAETYKNAELLKDVDPEKLIRMQKIQEILSTKQLSKSNERLLIDELMALEDSLGKVDDLEDAIRQAENNRVNESKEGARTKLDLGADPVNTGKLDPDIVPILDETANSRQSIPPGNVARNIADTTSIKLGAVEGDPAPIITESMRKKGLMVGSTSRDAVLGVAEEARDLGRFDALVDGFRFTTKQMNSAAWDIYTSIIAAENMEDVRALFIDNKALQPMLLGKFNVEYINEEQARAAAFALRDLTDRYLGRSVAQSSARVMDTLGREASTLATVVQELAPYADEDHVMDLIIDKMQFLMDEYALNKYISGWQLRNKNWFDQVPPKDIDTVIGQLTEEFRSAENAIHAKNLRFTETLKELSETNPLAMRPLVDAFAHTNGDVDSLAKLMKWASQQITPTGMLKSPDPNQLNLFARGAWGVVYNNWLSGISALRAVQGNLGQLVLKPITAILGHGAWGAVDDFEGLKRTMYFHGAMFETNRRALGDAWRMMKKAHKDPELMMQTYRKDFVFQEDKAWTILDDMVPLWQNTNNLGMLSQYNAAKTLLELSKHPGLRYGMTGMVLPDVYTQTTMGHYLSRMRAYDDVFTEFGYADPDRLLIAERNHYKSMFNSDGTMKDKALKALSGEVSLNLDDSLATWINKGTTAYPIFKFMFMFPRTGSNSIRNALSWQPISLIPGINKYSKTIWAQTDEDIAAALAEHGIDMVSTPNARELWKNLRAEYTGRIAFSSLLTKTLWDYAMAGNIRGNGHYNASRRQKERDQMGYTPKTINLGGKWVSFKGLIGVDQVLTILGDMSYYASDIDDTFLEDWQSKLTWTLAASFLNETPLQGMEPLVAAASGDLTGWNRLIAMMGLSFVPLSGAMGVLSKAITSAQKDIEGEVHQYMMNRLPVLSSFLPNQIDFWTGEPLNDIDNPILRMLNAVSPVKVSGTREDWRVWLEGTGWDGLGRLRKSSDGSYEYSAEQREDILEIMGSYQLYKQLIPLMNNKEYNKQLGQLRAHRATGDDLANERIKLETKRLPVIAAINRIVRIGQARAELEYKIKNKDIARDMVANKQVKEQMKRGDITGARTTQQENTLLQYGGTNR